MGVCGNVAGVAGCVGAKTGIDCGLRGIDMANCGEFKENWLVAGKHSLLGDGLNGMDRWAEGRGNCDIVSHQHGCA